LTGALVGAGLASGAGVHFGVLGKSFFLPLLLSPVLAMLITVVLYPLARAARTRLGITRESCVCVGEELVPIAQASGAAVASNRLQLAVGTTQTCVDRYQGAVVGVSAQSL